MAPDCATPAFKPEYFSRTWLTSQGYLQNTPAAGRGSAWFLDIDGVELVLREYRRGGLVRHLSQRHYLWLGEHRTRAYGELLMLVRLYQRGLPVPRPYACRVQRNGLRYHASLLMHRLPGNTFGSLYAQAQLPPDAWSDVGSCLARFHRISVRHADLNAHNVLLNLRPGVNESAVSLIDFDRARIIPSTRRLATGETPWQRASLNRLQRSLRKIDALHARVFDEAGWQRLEQAHRDALAVPANSSSR